MFSVGDKILHPLHGAGIIDRIVDEQVDGELRQYYVMNAPGNEMLVMIPVQTSETIGVRYVSDAAVVEDVLSRLPDIETEYIQNWNKRYRENMLRIRSGDMMEVARVIKDLMQRDAEKGLSTGERRMLQSAKQILISEIVLALDSSYDEVEERINELMAS